MTVVDASSEPLILVLGRQGSGKGEQSGRLAARLQLEHLSTGALLRAAARDETPIGRAAERYLVRGEPVPDEMVNRIVAERLALAAAEHRGAVLDGYPRSVAQAERLLELVAPRCVDVAVHLDVPRNIALERIQSRRICLSCHASGVSPRCARCGSPTTRRADDWPAAIGRRMSEYARDVTPLLGWLDRRGLLRTVDGRGSPAQVEARIASVVDPLVAGALLSRALRAWVLRPLPV